jgi:adenylate cyclase
VLHAQLEDARREEANRALERGTLMVLALAATSAVALPLVMWLNSNPALLAPWALSGLGAIAGGVIYALARRRLLWDASAWVVMLAFVSIPTVFFVVCELWLPEGAAIYINGPAVLLYLVIIAVTGCMFSFRLSVAAGLVAAAGYLLSVAIVRPPLPMIPPDSGLGGDQIVWPFFAFKASMMVAVGFVVGGLSAVSRRLTRRVLAESRRRLELDRLLGEYVSEEVRDKLLHDPPPEEGQLVEVAILFSDIRGFTALSETMPPAELVRRLNDYFDAMVAAIRAHGGVVDKFVGDAIMASFGGVLTLDSPCDAATRAARDMVKELERLNARWRGENLEPFTTGIGLDFGPVVLGSIGSADRKDFTVIGDAVNTASRVEGLTKDFAYPILLTAHVYDQLAGELRGACATLGDARVRGRASPITLYGLRGAHPTLATRAREPREGPFVPAEHDPVSS